MCQIRNKKKKCFRVHNFCSRKCLKLELRNFNHVFSIVEFLAVSNKKRLSFYLIFLLHFYAPFQTVIAHRIRQLPTQHVMREVASASASLAQRGADMEADNVIHVPDILLVSVATILHHFIGKLIFIFKTSSAWS